MKGMLGSEVSILRSTHHPSVLINSRAWMRDHTLLTETYYISWESV